MNKFKSKMLITFLLVFTLVMSLSLGIGKSSEAQSAKKQLLSEKAYIDPKGFFKIRPPEGWQVQEFRNDPRGKVKFICPDAYNTVLQVIAMASPFSNLEELFRDSKMAAERVKSKYNASFTIEKTSFANVPAIKLSVALQGKLKQVQMQFLLGKSHYTLSYGAPPDRYEEFFSIAMISYESFEPILKDVTKDEAIRHSVASKLRSARLLIRMGQTEYALIVINEGLQLEPGNKDLKELNEQLQRK